MNIKTAKAGNVAHVTIPGDKLDASNAAEFKSSVAPILDANKKVLFDMSELQFVDSSGLGAILSCLRVMNAAGGDLKLCGMRRPVMSLFELVRMHRVFDIFDTSEAALAAFGQ